MQVISSYSMPSATGSFCLKGCRKSFGPMLNEFWIQNGSQLTRSRIQGQIKQNRSDNFMIIYRMYNSNDQDILLESEFCFLDVFTMRALKRTDIRIPNTLICGEGQWKEWLFNSEKDRSHIILRKRKENLLTSNVVRFCCHMLDCLTEVKDCTGVQQIHQKLQGSLRNVANQQAKISVTYRTNKIPKSIKILDFIMTLANRNYSGTNCPESWRMVQQVIQLNSRNEEYYYVSAERPDKIANYRFNFLKRIVDEEQYEKIDEQNIFSIPERRDITKNLDIGLTQRQLTLALKVIDFLEANLRLSIRRIDLKMSINKTREPFLMTVLKIVNKVPAKFLTFSNIKAGSILNIHQYLEINDKFKNNPYKPQYSRRLTTEQPTTSTEVCAGDLCNIGLKNQIDNRSAAVLTSQISLDQIIRVRDNIKPVLSRLKDMNIISTEMLAQKQRRDSYDSQQQELFPSHSKYLRKVCKKCTFLYGIINKTIDFDSNNRIIENTHKDLSKNALSMISKDVTLPLRRNIRQPFLTESQVKLRKPINPTKNFLKMNIQMLKDGLPAFSSRKKIRKLSSDHKFFESQDTSMRKHRILSISKEPKESQTIDVKKRIKTQTDGFIRLSTHVRSKSQHVGADFTLNSAKAKLMSSISWVSANSVSELKNRYERCYTGFKSRQEIEVHPIQYLYADQRHSKERRPIYNFQNNSPLHDQSTKYHILTRPTITLAKLSQLCGSPQLVLKNNFIIDTLVCDQNTTITFCLLASEMFGNQKGSYNYENIIIVQDMFDCFLQYLQLAKDLLENSVNKRIILFNYPGQSYTTFKQSVVYDGLYMCEVVDKLLYRLSEELEIINLEKDYLKFAGFGYGGYITQLYTSINHTTPINITKILLVNSFCRLSQGQKKLLKKLQDIYSNRQKVPQSHFFLYYNLAINSSHQSNEQIDNKMILNPINPRSRLFILRNILNSTFNVLKDFEQVMIPVILIHSTDNCYVSTHEMQILASYSNNPTKKIHTRELYSIAGAGHDLLSDDPEALLNYFEDFVKF